jgi:hypothetical protein
MGYQNNSRFFDSASVHKPPHEIKAFRDGSQQGFFEGL